MSKGFQIDVLFISIRKLLVHPNHLNLLLSYEDSEAVLITSTLIKAAGKTFPVANISNIEEKYSNHDVAQTLFILSCLIEVSLIFYFIASVFGLSQLVSIDEGTQSSLVIAVIICLCLSLFLRGIAKDETCWLTITSASGDQITLQFRNSNNLCSTQEAIDEAIKQRG